MCGWRGVGGVGVRPLLLKLLNKADGLGNCVCSEVCSSPQELKVTS